MSSTVCFEVRVASTEAELAAACQVRETAYGHHLGEAVVSFSQVEAMDRDADTVVLVCHDKATGRALGTARIQTNASRTLQIERSVILPHHIAGHTRAEVTRLAVLSGADPMVKLLLMKAVYQFCVANQIDWLVICARNESLSRNYRRLGFKDLLAPGQMVPMAHAGNIPHFVLTMDIDNTRQEWQRQSHRLHAFMCEATHLGLPNFQPQAVHQAEADRLVA